MSRHIFGFVVATILVNSFAAADEPVPIARTTLAINGGNPDAMSEGPSISADGRWVAFQSDATNLVGGDLNGVTDIFVADRTTGSISRLSYAWNGGESNGASYAASISDDGRFVAFHSWASNLVRHDRNRVSDVFVHDRDPDGNGRFDEGNGATVRASLRSDGSEGNFGSYAPSISGDGSRVAFQSDASNLVSGDNNGQSDVFVHDLSTGVTERVSVDSGGVEANRGSYHAAISGNGSFVAFESYATNLVRHDTNASADIFRRDLSAGTTTRVSVGAQNKQSNSSSFSPSISADGLFVSFESNADNLVSGDTNFMLDIFTFDVTNASIERSSVDSSGGQGAYQSYGCRISRDSRWVAFTSGSAFDPTDSNHGSDVYVRDRTSGTTTLISRHPSGGAGDGCLWPPAVDGPAPIVAFTTVTDLNGQDTNGTFDIYCSDLSIPWPVAAWSNYGSGYPGTHGVPTVTASDVPRFGATILVSASNSLGRWSVALAAVGSEQASIPTSAGGTLLVDPFAWFALGLPPQGLALPFSIPVDDAWCGVTIDLQLLEADSGASQGLSFTPGLELLIGD